MSFLGIPLLKIAGALILLLGVGLLSITGKLSLPSFGRSSREPSGSDTPPPEGFVQHVETIRAASPGAPPEVREDYYREGCTRAQTLQNEILRLSPPSPTPGPAKKRGSKS